MVQSNHATYNVVKYCITDEFRKERNWFSADFLRVTRAITQVFLFSKTETVFKTNIRLLLFNIGPVSADKMPAICFQQPSVR